MENMPNRHQRRAMAKEAGYMKKKKNMSLKEKMELSRRAAEYGRQIHLANVERNLRMHEERAQQEEVRKLTELMDQGYSQEEAMKIFHEQNDRKDS